MAERNQNDPAFQVVYAAVVRGLDAGLTEDQIIRLGKRTTAES